MFLESSTKPISCKCINLGTLELRFILMECDDAVELTWNNLVICSLLVKPIDLLIFLLTYTSLDLVIKTLLIELCLCLLLWITHFSDLHSTHNIHCNNWFGSLASEAGRLIFGTHTVNRVGEETVRVVHLHWCCFGFTTLVIPLNCLNWTGVAFPVYMHRSVLDLLLKLCCLQYNRWPFLFFELVRIRPFDFQHHRLHQEVIVG